MHLSSISVGAQQCWNLKDTLLLCICMGWISACIFLHTELAVGVMLWYFSFFLTCNVISSCFFCFTVFHHFLVKNVTFLRAEENSSIPAKGTLLLIWTFFKLQIYRNLILTELTHGGVRWSLPAGMSEARPTTNHLNLPPRTHKQRFDWLMIRLADASVEASKVEHCSTFAASTARKATLCSHNAVRRRVTSPHSKWMGRSVEASTHAAVCRGRYL